MKLPPGYHIDWAGEYESQQRAQRRLAIIIPLTLLLIFLILYSMFGSMKWAVPDSRATWRWRPSAACWRCI